MSDGMSEYTKPGIYVSGKLGISLGMSGGVKLEYLIFPGYLMGSRYELDLMVRDRNARWYKTWDI